MTAQILSCDLARGNFSRGRWRDSGHIKAVGSAPHRPRSNLAGSGPPTGSAFAVLELKRKEAPLRSALEGQRADAAELIERGL
jgi:hypothetical protein